VKNHLAAVIALMLAGFIPLPEGRVMIFMVGDSTMADKPTEDNPERGWGQLFREFFDSTVTIENHAMNGRSTRSFIAEGRWQTVIEKVRTGDYVFIQFGHNDEKKEKTDRYTPPEDYRKNLMRFVGEARERGGNPVLCTPIVRRRFVKEGKFYDEHGVYPGIVRDLADSLKVPLIDMHRMSWHMIEALGSEASKKVYFWIRPGEYRSLPEGRQDDTHFSEYGAREMARLAVEGLMDLKLGLENHLKKGQ